MRTHSIAVPVGRFCAGQNDAAAAQERRRIAEMLRNGQTVEINSAGTMQRPGATVPPKATTGGTGRVVSGTATLKVPSGKLA